MACAALALVAAETICRREYFRNPAGDVIVACHEAFRYINANTSEETTVFGNHGFWTKRDYYAGPMKFLHPQTAWHLDRGYRTAATLEAVAAIADRAPYYLYVPRATRDREIGPYLLRTYRVKDNWGQTFVFDLTSRR